MKISTFITFSLSLTILSCSTSPEEFLKQSKNKILSSESISYHTKALYPNPVGKIDTIESWSSFSRNKVSVLGYDFLIKGRYYDNLNLNGIFKSVNKRENNIEVFTHYNQEKLKSHIEEINTVMYSPITLITQSDWEFISDTLINKNKFKNYFKVERNDTIDGNSIYTEQHIFFNPNSKLPERWERRNYYKGKLSQVVVYEYSDYSLKDSNININYKFPSNYPSTLYGKSENIEPLGVGQKLHLFSSTDLQNSNLNLEDFLGKKILLKFSSIGCGNSHLALEYMSQEGYELSDNISPIYLSIWDKQEDVIDYFDKVETSLKVIPNADTIADKYGVTSTPTFFLIDENGIIEKVVVGNNKEFLDSLNSIN